MNKHQNDNSDRHDTPHTVSIQFNKLIIFTVLGIILLAFISFALFRYSQNKANDLSLSGSNPYSNKSSLPPQAPSPKPIERFTASSDVSWNVKAGYVYPYSFSYPSTMVIVIFPNDITDKVALVWADVPPQRNIIFNMELLDKLAPEYVNQPKMEYVKNWWKSFSGLKGVSKIETFTNTGGLKGYKAWYINTVDQTPNVDIFFEVPKHPEVMMHMANGLIDPTIFDRMVDSLKWSPLTPIIRR